MSFHHIFWPIEKPLISNEGGGYGDADGKMGFYYKESEILPPLPGEAQSLQTFSSPSRFLLQEIYSREFLLRCIDFGTPFCAVGYHRYVLGRGDGNVFQVLGAQKVPRFDYAAEVSKHMITTFTFISF